MVLRKLLFGASSLRPCPSGKLSFANLQGSFIRFKSTVTHHAASTDAQREVPTPLVLLSASKWSGQPEAKVSLKSFISQFTRNGWNVASIDVDPKLEADTSQGILASLESELALQMRESGASGGGSPFPPLMIAKGLDTLIAESYISSHPLSGLVLLNPPLTPAHARGQCPDQLPTSMEPFNYEIRSPCKVAWSQDEVQKLAFWDVHRIEEAREDEADEALDRFVWDLNSDADEHDAAAYQVRKWAEDECGISYTNRRSPPYTDEECSHAKPELARNTKRNKNPDWFCHGKYQRNPTGSKKEPLLMDSDHLEESFIRGSGPGGQAINKLSTCVQLKHSPTGLIVKCQETRSRQQNRELARRRMSRELELHIFGEKDSVLGREVFKARQKKAAKARKQHRKGSEPNKRNSAQ